MVGYGTNLVGSSNTDWWIKKFSSDGVEDTTDWNKMFDGGLNGGKAHSVAIDPSDGSVYVVGYGWNLVVTGSSNEDWWIKKFSSSGVEDSANWNKIFSSTGSSNDVANSVAVASDGSVYVVGYGFNLVTPSSGFDWWIKKFNSSGVEQWEKEFNRGSDDVARSVSIDPSDGSVYVVGHGFNLVTPSSGEDWWIKKFNSAGVEQ